MPSEPLASEKVTIDRKVFFIDLKENQRGRFMKITEDVGGRRDTIMLPIEHAAEFIEALQNIMQVQSSADPPKKLDLGERAVMADGNEYNIFQMK